MRARLILLSFVLATFPLAAQTVSVEAAPPKNPHADDIAYIQYVKDNLHAYTDDVLMAQYEQREIAAVLIDLQKMSDPADGDFSLRMDLLREDVRTLNHLDNQLQQNDAL